MSSNYYKTQARAINKNTKNNFFFAFAINFLNNRAIYIIER